MNPVTKFTHFPPLLLLLIGLATAPVLADTNEGKLLGLPSKKISFNFIQDRSPIHELVELADFEACNENRSAHPHCGVFLGKYLKWEPREQQILINALNEASSFPRAKLFLEKLYQSGVKRILFVRKPEVEDHAAATQRFDTVFVALNPRYFSSEFRFHNISERAHILLHELVHVYDTFNGHGRPFWNSLAKTLEWQNPRRLHSNVDAKIFQKHFNSRNAHLEKNNYRAAIVSDFSFARTHGFPSLYSMVKLREYFAELATFLMHDDSLVDDLPSDVIDWLRSNELSWLLPAKVPSSPDWSNQPERVENTTANFVGKLLVHSTFHCTVSLLRHGVAVTARHCIEAHVPKKAHNGMFFPYINLVFSTDDGSEVIFSGLSFKALHLDRGASDWVVIEYDPQITSEKIHLPRIRVAKLPDFIPKDSIELFNIAYPQPSKIRKLRRFQTNTCRFTNEARVYRIPGIPYKGIFYGTTCPATFGSSGSPFYAEDPTGKADLVLYGVLGHTFSTDANGNILPEAIHTDAWGEYTDSNFSPTFVSGGLAKLGLLGE